MTYMFERDDHSLQDGFRRIAKGQLKRMVEEADAGAADIEGAVHKVRKRCKKLRGLLRLVRPSFEDYSGENAFFRDAARALSSARDSKVLIDTYDALLDACNDQVERPAFGPIRRRLTERLKSAEKEGEIDLNLARFQSRMVEAVKRVDHWRLRDNGFSTLAAGSAKTYGRAQKAMKEARGKPMPDNFHEWRKRTKYHWYHARLLSPIWPESMKGRCDSAHSLADMLGEHHDLAVFSHVLKADAADFGKAKEIEILIGLARHRQAVLEAQSFALGARLLAEPAPALTKRGKSTGMYGATSRRKTGSQSLPEV